MTTYYIYTLTNPNTNEVFYVGSTIRPFVRQLSHRLDKKQNHKTKYVQQHQIVPQFDLIDQMECRNRSDIRDIEMYWIHQFKAWGFPITNYQLLGNRYIPKTRKNAA